MEITERKIAQDDGTESLRMSIEDFVRYTEIALLDEFELAGMNVNETQITVEFNTGEKFSLDVRKL